MSVGIKRSGCKGGHKRNGLSWGLGLGVLLLVCGLGTQGLGVTTIWAPMWDVRHRPMEWEVRAEGNLLSVNGYFDGGGGYRVTTRDGLTTLGAVGGVGDLSTGPLAVVPGEVYKVQVTSGFHVRMHWVGVQWARLGEGQQGAGPGDGIGFQSDAELGFDARWDALPSQFADTVWSFYVSDGEQLSLSVEHMTGDPAGTEKFEFISPSNVVTLVDANGIPGSGTDHYPARGGNLGSMPDPTSPYWQEYTAPVAESGWWGFKLYAKTGPLNPYAWHYVLDRTDNAEDPSIYLRPGALLDPNSSVTPEPVTATLGGMGLCVLIGVLRRRRGG